MTEKQYLVYMLDHGKQAANDQRKFVEARAINTKSLDAYQIGFSQGWAAAVRHLRLHKEITVKE